MRVTLYYLAACISLVTLIFVCLSWELRLAPLQSGGSWLALKCLPLLAPLFGILHGRLYTYRWASMLILVYFIEGVLRLSTDTGASRWLGALELLLSLVFFCSAIAYVRGARSLTGLSGEAKE